MLNFNLLSDTAHSSIAIEVILHVAADLVDFWFNFPSKLKQITLLSPIKIDEMWLSINRWDISVKNHHHCTLLWGLWRQAEQTLKARYHQ